MKRLVIALFALVIIVAGFVGTFKSQQSGAANPNNMPKEVLDRWEKELSNWGRWGEDDQLGATNLITPEKRRQAAALVKDGFTVSLASTPNTVKAIDNPSPYQVNRNGLGTDTLTIPYHGIAHTHFDSLDHIYNEAGVGYNGYKPDKDAVMKQGHSRNGVQLFKNGIVTRGILMDIPRLKGVPYLEIGQAVRIEDLEAWEKKAGIKVSSGDALLIRTGRWAARKALGPYSIARDGGKAAGLHPSVLPWLKQRGIALLAGENGQGVAPSDGATHDLAIRLLGVPLIDQADLDAVAEAAAARNRWEFMFVLAPLAIPGGTGGPVNPLAIF